MTRETKIGLLVGLAFIIVIGILLSDHLTTANEPQQAPLAQAGGNARSAVTTPGAANVPAVTQIPPTQNITPQQPVPTKEEITPRQPPVEIVQIGGAAPEPANAQRERQPVDPPIELAQGAQMEPPTLANQQDVARPTDPRVPGSIAQVAEQMGEPLVPADPQTTTTPQPLALAGARVYKAEPGDNLAKIAQKALGKPSIANINAIIAANPTLQQNPNLVVAGRTYNIPSGATAAAPSQSPAHVATLAPPANSEYVYVVKPGDSLTRIALTQLGTATAVEAIKDLNREVLKGGDVIHPNMKLRLPAKPIASAS